MATQPSTIDETPGVSIIPDPIDTIRQRDAELRQQSETAGRMAAGQDMNTAQAMAARDALMKKAIAGERLVIQAGDNVIELTTSPFMREVRKSGGAVVHTTPHGKDYVRPITAETAKGGGIYFSHEPLTRFSLYDSRGRAGTKPTMYIANRETAEQLFTFIVVAALATWAIMNKGWFLKLVVCPVLIVYGLRLAGGETLFYPLWVAGVVIAVTGTYFLYQQAALLAGLIRDKRGTNG